MSFSESTRTQYLFELNEANSIEQSAHLKGGSHEDSINDSVKAREALKDNKKQEFVNEDLMDFESTLAINSQESCFNKTRNNNVAQEFDLIARKVDSTIQELNRVYKEIGYSSQEIADKKSHIFDAIQGTLVSFSDNLQREKSNIESECEWLRQQIKIILAMINDNNGEKNLSLVNRGILFENSKWFEMGYSNETFAKANNMSRKDSFYDDSPFNITATGTDNDLSFQNNFGSNVNRIPEITLAKLKYKLNSIFMDVLKEFVVSFKKLNDLNLIYLDISDTIRPLPSSNQNSLMTLLPGREEAEYHRQILGQFDIVTRHLKISFNATAFDTEKEESDNYEFIISSPQKPNKESEKRQLGDLDNEMRHSTGNAMSYLRDLNYELVRVIRSLKVTKITPETLKSIQREISICEAELIVREELMIEKIKTCLELIEILHLSDDQLVKMQKQYNILKAKEDNIDGYIDLETLKFMHINPRHFGLNDAHISVINKFTSVLQSIKDSKQRKLNNYSEKCQDLWKKFHEDPKYTESFIEANNNLTDLSLMNFKMELNRLYIKRSEYIENFITDARVQIEKLWDRMYYSTELRKRFKYFNYDLNDGEADKEVILNEHEAELLALKAEFKSKTKIYTLYDLLNDLLKDQVFLRNSSKDSSRLLSKNSCKILLNEEKLRKRIEKNMPKIIDTLKGEIIKDDEKRKMEGQPPLTVYDENFLEKVVKIETESLGSRNNRSFGNKSLQDSPNRSKNPTEKSSPIKEAGVSPSTKGVQNNALRRGMKNKNIRSSPPKHFLALKKPSVPRQRAYRNPTAIKLTNALNTSLGTEFIESTIDSPVVKSQNNSNFERFKTNRLQPLNSPLVANQFDIHGDSPLSYNAHVQMPSSPKVFPLPLGINNDNGTSNLFSSIREKQSSISEDQENVRFELSPVLLKNFKLHDRPDSSATSDKLSSLTCDSSTIVGDDYQLWRQEKIKELNDP
ncbi:uncharacterized protein PRCAT00002611001 [Priceomyces carsonii]|uniref:uncharacterized protein n=1 Tax=Priceomyces carsonii TaxID=28549 RepID=UPI002ED7FD46|nr:unnamed protein product [Priceomyces carsonii]